MTYYDHINIYFSVVLEKLCFYRPKEQIHLYIHRYYIGTYVIGVIA